MPMQPTVDLRTAKRIAELHRQGLPISVLAERFGSRGAVVNALKRVAQPPTKPVEPRR